MPLKECTERHGLKYCLPELDEAVEGVAPPGHCAIGERVQEGFVAQPEAKGLHPPDQAALPVTHLRKFGGQDIASHTKFGQSSH